MAQKKQSKGMNNFTGMSKIPGDKIKVEGLKRKKRRMRLKAKDNNEANIEKFSAQSSKSAKYAKTVVKKRENVTEVSDILQGKKSDMLINEGANSNN
eukprot:CAMPEP_0176371844 /NCGR_PEP_ID=MMETSP0126-20121128/24985_1 /TAXON_ID=141414 ORGANISM="Strombidinopsis acuminatum, Strain SPMC142" /NCGR_SAMPLE_ID=MMETSP0126 /ASSEMBLY_ACC=CAM_ASM_000229 /LENGTH=96 /DNA_ID=CAMNT_0017731469 /DNA_START=710 /DNA_END=1001 /DNA_ORIENTATION=+